MGESTRSSSQDSNSAHAGDLAKREGRLADPSATLGTDPRAHPSLRATMAAFEMDGYAAPPPFDRTAGMEAINAFWAGAHEAYEGFYAAVPAEWPGEIPAEITKRTLTIRGVDGNEIPLYIYRPAGETGPLPCLMYIHGGGMVILDADNKVHQQWSRDLAATGMVVVTVGFRNSWSPEGQHAFPAGLNDCSTALDWVHEHRSDLGITKIVLEGESGGGNLVLAMALKAKREGRLDRIAGVYSIVPFISGGYAWPTERKLRELPSMVENDGYYLNHDMMDLVVAMYDPTGVNTENPLAWPYFATEADVEGLPPHFIEVNELDFLRDEGIAYFRTLQRAGVPAVGKVNLGLCHAANMTFRQAIPDAYKASIHAINSFVQSL